MYWTVLPTTPGTAAAAGGAGLSLNQERALLAKEQRINMEMKNAVLCGTYAPAQLLAEVLAAASQAVAERMDHLPGQLRRSCPGLPISAIDIIMATIAKARNEWVSQTIELVSNTVLSTDDATDDGTPADGQEGA